MPGVFLEDWKVVLLDLACLSAEFFSLAVLTAPLISDTFDVLTPVIPVSKSSNASCNFWLNLLEVLLPIPKLLVLIEFCS